MKTGAKVAILLGIAIIGGIGVAYAFKGAGSTGGNNTAAINAAKSRLAALQALQASGKGTSQTQSEVDRLKAQIKKLMQQQGKKGNDNKPPKDKNNPNPSPKDHNNPNPKDPYGDYGQDPYSNDPYGSGDYGDYGGGYGDYGSDYGDYGGGYGDYGSDYGDYGGSGGYNQYDDY